MLSLSLWIGSNLVGTTWFLELEKQNNDLVVRKVWFEKDKKHVDYEVKLSKENIVKIDGLSGLNPTIYVQGSDPFKLDLIISQGLEKLGFEPVEMFRKGSSIWSKWIKQ